MNGNFLHSVVENQLADNYSILIPTKHSKTNLAPFVENLNQEDQAVCTTSEFNLRTRILRSKTTSSHLRH
jgi:hypothetical protein